MRVPLSSHKVGLIAIFLILLIQVHGQPLDDEFGESQCPNVNRDMSWFRQNAKSLLFMEHLQKRAAEENLYGWSDVLGSDQYSSQLRRLENQFVMPEEVPDDCYDQMPIPKRFAQRISFLEDRLESCGSAQPCAYDEEEMRLREGYTGGIRLRASYGGGLALQRLSTIQAELMRQRNVIRMMRMRLETIDRQCEGIPKNSNIFFALLLEFLFTHSQIWRFLRLTTLLTTVLKQALRFDIKLNFKKIITSYHNFNFLSIKAGKL